MILSRTPFRISFFGGGTDYPGWYAHNGGAVLSTTINKYCHISCRFLPPFFKHKYLIRYRLTEMINSIREIQHPSVRHCLSRTGLAEGIEMVHTGDLPARSGVGSSSAFTVGFLAVLTALKGNMITKRQLAEEAIDVEQNMIGENVGSQDQVAVAFGGLNRIDFGTDDGFSVQPLTINRGKLLVLQDHLMLFFTGLSRTASEIAASQIKNIPSNTKQLTCMKEMVDQAVSILNNGTDDIHDFGRLLNESWQLKRSLTDQVSNPWVDGMYEAACKAGAIGGKLCGAGGGGFLLLFVQPDRRTAVKEKLQNALHVPFRFETQGSQIIFYEVQDFV